MPVLSFLFDWDQYCSVCVCVYIYTQKVNYQNIDGFIKKHTLILDAFCF